MPKQLMYQLDHLQQITHELNSILSLVATLQSLDTRISAEENPQYKRELQSRRGDYIEFITRRISSAQNEYIDYLELIEKFYLR